MSRVPIRLRLTLAFAFGMALVLTATGVFVYARLGHELDRALDRGLLARAADLRGQVAAADSTLRANGRGLIESDESFAQVLTTSGRVVDATPQLPARSLLTDDELARAAAGTTTFERSRSPAGDEAVRLLATPVETADGRLVIVVGASTVDRSEALASLREQLLLFGPIALILACAAAYLLAARALAPVERMRRRAETISRAGRGDRLPEPPADDEVRHLARTLNAMLGRLDDAAIRERRFVADASHELRRPLTLMKTELEVTLRSPADAEGLRRALRSALEEVDGLARLADDLLLITQADQGRLPIRPEPVSLGPLLTGVARRFGPRADEQGRDIAVDVQVHELVADRIRLEQALGNLVDNALRHGAGTVSLGAHADAAGAVLTVSDGGGGFPPDFTDRAFDRFSRADAARTTGGAGLGLSIVAAIAEAHGGTATIVAAETTCVRIDLPGPVRATAPAATPSASGA